MEEGPRWVGAARGCGVVGVAGVVGGDEGAFAGAGGEGPAVVGLELVVVVAEGVELVEAGVVGAGPGVAVVDLDQGAVAVQVGTSR